MKRPLFWAAALFALGEVTCIYADGILIKSIIVIMLICGALFAKKHGSGIGICGCSVLFLFFALGFINVRFRDCEKRFGDLKYYEGYGTIYKLEDNDELSDMYIHVDAGFNVVVYKEDCEGKCYKYGDRVFISGELKAFSHNRNPGCFDFKQYYLAKNVMFSIDKSSVSPASENDSSVYKYFDFLYMLRKNLKSKFYGLTDDKTAGIYCGILLGERREVDEQVRLDYQNNGFAHILAISGLHISLLFGIVFKLLRKLGINRYIAGVLGLMLLVSYAFMTGFSMSTLRALCMIAISLGAIYTGEYYDMLTSLSAALLVILLYNPYKLTDSSVILSVTAMVGACVGRYIFKHLDYFYYINTFKKKIAAALVISASINLVMLPFSVLFYHEITPYSILTNIIVIPLMTIIVGFGMAAVLCSYVSVSAGAFLIKPGEMILKFYEVLCRLLYRLPCARINIGRIRLYQVLLYYLMLFFMLAFLDKKLRERIRKTIYKKYHRWLSGRKWIMVCVMYYFLIASVFAGGLLFSYVLSQNELVVFVAVGQGDGILLRSESGVNMVIDGGSTSEKQLGKYTMLPVIKYFGMAHVDYWFISHTDADHISGLEYILELGERSGVRIDNLVFSYGMYVDDDCQRLLKLAEEKGVNVIFMKAGDCVADESFRITCVHPDEGYCVDPDEGYCVDVGGGENYTDIGVYVNTGGFEIYSGAGAYAGAGGFDINDASLCLSYSSPNLNILFTGDMGEEALDYMLLHERQYLLSHYDILKVPHHGSRNSISYNFYNLIDFESAVISCGENNLYGHPHEEVLQKLEQEGIYVLRTDKDGAVVIEKCKQDKEAKSGGILPKSLAERQKEKEQAR